MKDFYHILGIPGNASQTDIRKAYYKLARLYHPDKNPDAAQHQKFLEINEAYETLGDKQKRQLYHYRWVNFKNNPRPVAPAVPRPASQTRSTTRQAYRPPNYAAKPRRDYKEYEPLLRKICKLCLLLSAVLLLDRLFVVEHKQEVVLQYASNAAPGSPRSEHRYNISTPKTQFGVSVAVAKELYLELGQHIDVYQTPLLGEEIKIRFLGKIFPVNGASIYHNFFFLIVAQLVFGTLGLVRKLRWSARLNAGIISGVSAIFAVIVILLTL